MNTEISSRLANQLYKDISHVSSQSPTLAAPASHSRTPLVDSNRSNIQLDIKKSLSKKNNLNKRRSISFPVCTLPSTNNWKRNESNSIAAQRNDISEGPESVSLARTAPITKYEIVNSKRNDYIEIDIPNLDFNGVVISPEQKLAQVNTKSLFHNPGSLQEGYSSKHVNKEDHFKPLSGTSKISMKMARSGGGFRLILKDLTNDMSYDDSCKTIKSSNPQQPNLNSGSASSFFEFESPSSDGVEILRDSPISLDIESNIKSPHNPPFESLIDNTLGREASIRQSIINQQNTRFLPIIDYFQEYMEERLIRWRPNDSQFNNDATMNGKHPYQQSCDRTPKSQTNNNFFASFKSWFSNEKQFIEGFKEQLSDVKSSILQQRNSHIVANSPNKMINDKPYPKTPDFSKILSNIDLKPNSSNSLLLNLQPSTNFGIMIADEPIPVHEPQYTPSALPFNEFVLNFEKKSSDEPDFHRIDRNSNEVIESMDEDIRDLIDGVDNFLSECFSSIWSFTLSIGNTCQNFY